MSDYSNVKKQVDTEKDIDYFKDHIEEFTKEFIDNPDKLDELTDEQLMVFQRHMNPYGKTIDGEDGRYTCLSYTNLREQYLEKLLTTTLVGFVYRACDEFTVSDEDLTTEINDKDFEEVIENPDKKNETFMKNINNQQYIKIKQDYIVEELKKSENLSEEDVMKKIDDIMYEAVKKYKLTKTIEKSIEDDIAKKINDIVTEKIKNHRVMNIITEKEVEEMKSRMVKEENEHNYKKYYTYFKQQNMRDKFTTQFSKTESNEAKVDEMVETKIQTFILDVIKKYKLDDETEIEINKKVKEEVDKLTADTVKVNNKKKVDFTHKLIEEQSLYERSVIMRFLNTLFKYNPDVHVRDSHITKKKNKSKKPIKEMNEEELLDNYTPPVDTFYKLNMYKTMNYEVLRKCVEEIYGAMPDLEIAFNVFDSFNSLEDAEKYVEKNKDKIITDIHTVQNNKWVFAGPFKENRERIKYYNEKTEILEGILKRMEDDAKIGNELLKEKVKYKKVKNVKEYGPDHPSFLKYKKEHGHKGMYTPSEDEIAEETILVDETGKPIEVDEDGTPKDALEVDVFHVDVGAQEMTKSRFYTKAKAPSENK